MLLHVVLSRECLVAFRTECIFFARVLLGMASSVSRGGEVVVAFVVLCERAGVLILLGGSLGGRRGGVR